MKLPASLVDMATVARASGPSAPCTLRAVGGGAITPELRDEMLARCAAGGHVELELEVLAYEQRAGEQNRNFVRFRDGGLMAMGRSGVGTPFLRDHDQDSALARGGTVIASQTQKRGDGDYAIRQTVRLTAPWAVELALRGLLSGVSIGWDPSARATCSLCTLDYWRGCMHIAGRRYRAITDPASATPAYAEDLAGPMVCERVYGDASLVETSAVNVPAVPEAHIEAIRASLALSSGAKPQGKNVTMLKLIALLGLAATAGEDEVVIAVTKLKSDRATDATELQVIKAELGVANAELATHRATARKAAEDKLITDAIARGAMAPGSNDEKLVRELYGHSPERANALLAERASGSVTPVRTAPQTQPAPADPHASRVDGAVAGVGGDSKAVRANLARTFPNAKPEELDAMIARVVGMGRA